MYGYNVLDCYLPHLSYDKSGSASNFSILVHCGRCNMVGSIEPSSLSGVAQLDMYLCDGCGDAVTKDMFNADI
jgi:hypothetical protein